MTGITVDRAIHFGTGRKSRKKMQQGEAPAPVPAPVPRVARLMALAIRLDHLIRSGEVADQAELARLGHVTRARLTQIMNLLNLAPDIQEEIFTLERRPGRLQITERNLRPIAAEADWTRQRRMWGKLGISSRTFTLAARTDNS